MIENARTQLILVLLVAAAAVWYAFHKPILGVDLKGGVQLIYEVPEELVETAVAEQREQGNAVDTAQIMASTISIIEDRADPTGAAEVAVTKRGDYGILIEMPAMSEAEAQEVESRIERLGKLEMRITANDQYETMNDEGVSFTMANETKRLEEWLDATDDAGITNKDRVLEDPTAIDIFNRLTPAEGGPEGYPYLQWRLHRIKPSINDDAYWQTVMASYSGRITTAVPLFDVSTLEFDGKKQAHKRPDGSPDELLELVAVNYHSESFTGQDLNANGCYPTIDVETGDPAVGYQLQPEKVDAYGDWSGKFKGLASAIILNGEVRSAPTFIDAIRGGQGIIKGGFSDSEVKDLVRVLQTGSLKVEPRMQSKVVIGATLGEEAVNRGLMSIAVGGALVLAFILAYYRLAGLIAFVAIAFNILLIWGALQFTRSTLTLPGIAGMVLTMGMAIDANILIYERIREELRGGKELLNACRTGFEKAMVAILDSNITTFLAGIVLYNVGVGPIKGFAVTLMIGILTTLFTAFFVTRLAFHWMLANDKLKSFRVASWLQDAKFRFLNYAKMAFAISLVLIIGSVIYAFTADRDKILALDFTGGANMQMVLTEPMDVTDVRKTIAANSEFAERFGEPSVNTYGEADGETARKFNLKIKLTDVERQKVEEERDLAQEAGEDFEAPYVRLLRQVFEDKLVQPAFSTPTLSRVGESPLQSAYIELHFSTEVSVAKVREKLAESKLRDLEVRAKGSDAEVTRDVVVEWTETSDVLEPELFGIVRTALEKHNLDALGNIDAVNDNRLRDQAGELVLLSNPFPEATELGGRLVGELRMAAIGAIVLSLFLIVMYIRVRFREYKYGLAAVAAVTHDVAIALGCVTLATSMGWVDAELSLPMIAAFLTIVGYSINDTIIIFDRIRENLGDNTVAGVKEDFGLLVNRSINQTLSRTILTSGTTLFVVLAQFFVNKGSGSDLEGFSFALIIGIVAGTYSTIFIACPILVWLRTGDTDAGVIRATEEDETLAEGDDEEFLNVEETPAEST